MFTYLMSIYVDLFNGQCRGLIGATHFSFVYVLSLANWEVASNCYNACLLIRFTARLSFYVSGVWSNITKYKFD